MSIKDTVSSLTQDQAVEAFDLHLKRVCGIGVDDAGLERADVVRYVEGATTKSAVVDAVLVYARDYDLTVRGTGWN